MKKLLSATVAVALVFGASSAFAQTMKVSGMNVGDPAGLSQVLDLPDFVGAPRQVDIVVLMDGGSEATSAAEFIVTQLSAVVPGVFKLATVKINNTPLDLGSNVVGEYILAFGACEPVGELELVRETWGDFSGAIQPNSDVVLTLRGFGPGDTKPSSFNGELGFVNCTDGKFTAQMGGADGGFTGSGVTFGDGELITEPTPLVVPTEAGTMGQLKARF